MKSEIWRARLWAYAPVVLWAGVIFFLSSPQGSMAQTSKWLGPLLHFLLPGASEDILQIYHQYIRKTAHFTEYAVLALLSARALSRSPGEKLRKLRFLLPIALVAAVASIDELNQSFEPSRTGSAYDVLLDLSGGIAAIIFVWLYQRSRRVTSNE